MTLEANQREMAVQRSEILRLREQVKFLSGQEGGAAGGSDGHDARPQSSQERPVVHSPVKAVPRSASSMD